MKVEKPKKKGGWFGFMGKNKDQGGEPNQEEEKYEEIFKDLVQIDNVPPEIAPKEYVWLFIDFQLLKGLFELSKISQHLNGISQESLSFTYENFHFNTAMRMRGGTISSEIHNLSLKSSDEISEQVIFQKLQPNDLPFLRLQTEINPLDEEYAAKINFISQPIEVNYSPQSMAKILSFFVVPNVQQSAKTAAWDTLQGLQDSTQETLTDLLYGEAKYSINIQACGPRIKIPSATGQGNFMVSLGDVFLTNDAKISDDHYEDFNLAISSIELQFQAQEKEFVEVLSNCEIHTSLSFLKAKYRKRKQYGLFQEDMPDVKLSGELPNLKLLLSPSIFHQLLRIGDSFKFEDNILNSITLEKQQIMKHAILTTILQKQVRSVQSWYQFIAILSGGYVYFFKNEHDLIAESYFYIKDSNILDIQDPPNSLRLQNRYGECSITFKDASTLNCWKEGLNQQILEIVSFKSASIANERTSPRYVVLTFQFSIPTVSLKLTNEENSAISEFGLKDIILSSSIRPHDVNLHMKLQSLEILDLQRRSRSVHFNILARSINDDVGLIDMDLNALTDKSPLFRDQDIEITLKLGSVELNWNPDFLGSIINFFEFAEYSDPSLNAEIPILQMLKPEHVCVNLHIEVESIDLYLNVVERELCLALASAIDFKTDVLIRNGAYE